MNVPVFHHQLLTISSTRVSDTKEQSSQVVCTSSNESQQKSSSQFDNLVISTALLRLWGYPLEREKSFRISRIDNGGVDNVEMSPSKFMRIESSLTNKVEIIDQSSGTFFGSSLRELSTRAEFYEEDNVPYISYLGKTASSIRDTNRRRGLLTGTLLSKKQTKAILDQV